MAIECVGRPELVQACQHPLRAFGTPRRSLVRATNPMPIEPITALLKELTIRFSVATARMSSERPSPHSPTVNRPDADDRTDALRLARLGEAFDLVRTAGVHGRVLVNPGGARFSGGTGRVKPPVFGGDTGDHRLE